VPQSTDKPLAGKRIVITRAPEQSASLTAALQNLGAEVLLMPTVEFASPRDFTALDAAITHFADFDWILFTSQNAVGFFAKRLAQLSAHNGLTKQVERLHAAAVGPATAEAATKEGFRVDYVAKNHTGEALAREVAQELKGKRVLLPHSDRADDRLPAALGEAGAEVTDVIAYRTGAPKSLDPDTLQRLRDAEVDAIIFASPSAFHNLQRWIPAAELATLSRRVQFAAIGPTTARALRDAGAHVAIESSDASAAALATAIADHYQQPDNRPTVTRQP
jgi:uroporphyrinogen-III synthase